MIEDAGGVADYEFQRLHGMGEVLYETLLAELPQAACRIYAPVGGHRDLLAYLVRRLLENGANSSFVSAAADSNGADRRHPAASAERRSAIRAHARHQNIPLPRDLYAPARRNSAGVEFGDRAALERAARRDRAGDRRDRRGAAGRRHRARRPHAAR